MLPSVRDYRAFVAELLTEQPHDEAMASAVGGAYDAMGDLQAGLLIELGLKPGNVLIDLGCGSGRLAAALSRNFSDRINYLGIDVVPDLLGFSAGRSCPSYQFVLTDGDCIPAEPDSADYVAAFSVFTHLRPRERSRYLREAHRVLRHDGRLVMSFLEPWTHRRIFLATIWHIILGNLPHHNTFTTKTGIEFLSAKSGFVVDRFIAPDRIGQTVAVMRALHQ